MKEQKIYTFDDWLTNQFWDEKTIAGEYVANDSSKYLELVGMGKMTYEELNKIQDAQAETYEYLITSTLETNERFFFRQLRQSLDIENVVRLKIKRVEKFLRENEDLYYEVILPRLHRGMKPGAKFILPEDYNHYKKHQLLDAFLPNFSRYQLNINGSLKVFPTPDQSIYSQIEVQAQWLKKLLQIKNSGYHIPSIKPVKSRQEKQLLYALSTGNIIPSQTKTDSDALSDRHIEIAYNINCVAFQNSIKAISYENIETELEFHLRTYLRAGGTTNTWIEETKRLLPSEFSPKQQDAYLSFLEKARSLPNPFSTAEDIEMIFDGDKPGYLICLEIMKEFEIIDKNTGKSVIAHKPRKGYLVFAIIDAFKRRTATNKLLSRNFTDVELLDSFNRFLNTNFKQVKRDSTGYALHRKIANEMIQQSLKR